MAKRMGTRQYLAEKMRQGMGGRVSVVGDERTCPECMSRNGKYTTEQPPFHPNCRCSIHQGNEQK